MSGTGAGAGGDGTNVVVVATTNPGKVRELDRLLAGTGLVLRRLCEVDPTAPPVVEDGDTFEANARKKARAAAERTGLRALADDSGLEVDALGGAPGVWSARYATLPADSRTDRGVQDRANVDKLLRALEGVPQERRTARFRCVLVLADPSRSPGDDLVVDGRCEGRIGDAPRGQHGFGYDPIFVPEGEHRTMAELTPGEKDARSHRAAAVAALRARLGD